MTPSVDELKNAFNLAFAEYMDAMHVSKRALEEAMQSSAVVIHNAYTTAKKTEEEKRKVYYEAAWKLQEALVRR